VHTDLDTLATALYVKIDDALKEAPQLCRWRPPVGIAPRLTDAELLTLAVMQALLGYTSEARWLRYAHKQLRHLFPYLPGQAGYNKRLRAAVAQVKYFIRALAVDTDYWTDDLWIADSTRWSAAARARPSSGRRWRAGPATATAPLTPATSGGCACTWSVPCTACRSPSR
jgi:hypothetical protein